MHFRDYTSADVEAMFQLDVACFAGPFQFDRDSMKQFAEQHGAIVILVEDGFPIHLIAFIIVTIEVRSAGLSAYIVTIDVARDHRRLGIGAAMLARAEAAARLAGAVEMTLHVAANNSSAIALYEDRQYCRVSRVRSFYREARQDALVFTKPL